MVESPTEEFREGMYFTIIGMVLYPFLFADSGAGDYSAVLHREDTAKLGGKNDKAWLPEQLNSTILRVSFPWFRSAFNGFQDGYETKHKTGNASYKKYYCSCF